MQDGKHVVLCVDDDPDFRESIAIILEASGFAVVSAASAEEGVRCYQESNPDLILADLMMEEVDAGTSMVTKLKALGNTAPIFLLSSIGDGLAANIDYADLGLAGVFQKPIDPAAFIGTLKAKLG